MPRNKQDVTTSSRSNEDLYPYDSVWNCLHYVGSAARTCRWRMESCGVSLCSVLCCCFPSLIKRHSVQLCSRKSMHWFLIALFCMVTVSHPSHLTWWCLLLKAKQLTVLQNIMWLGLTWSWSRVVLIYNNLSYCVWSGFTEVLPGTISWLCCQLMNSGSKQCSYCVDNL